MNFISTFEELNKLYDEKSDVKAVKNEAETAEEACETAECDGTVEEACTKEELVEAVEDEVDEPADEEVEIVDDEADASDFSDGNEPVEAAAEDDEPRQIIIACEKCGALVIKDEADIVVDEESDLVNVEDTCEYCEETEGYKIVGVVAPYDVEAAEVVEEGIGDWARKKFDMPASLATQQAWEAELNGELGEISDERRKELEDKFMQQRDWEARHPDKVKTV